MASLCYVVKFLQLACHIGNLVLDNCENYSTTNALVELVLMSFI